MIHISSDHLALSFSVLKGLNVEACRRTLLPSVSHQVKANTTAKGTKVSLANAPKTPHSGRRYHRRVSKLQSTAARKQASPASMSPASWRLGILKLSK